MYFEDHNPPHFHARYGEFKAEILIEDFSVKAGNLLPRALGLVVEWASLHKNELMKNWELLAEQQIFNKIDPLT